MTPKQEERLRNKIASIRKELAADKQRWGGAHHDGSGFRYVPPGLFIKLRDYKGGLRYLRWFNRTFPDDSAYPIFLFEWTLILFKTGNVKEAEKKAIETYYANHDIFDIFLGNELPSTDKNENWQTAQLVQYFNYSMSDAEYADVAEWLEDFLASEPFT